VKFFFVIIPLLFACTQVPLDREIELKTPVQKSYEKYFQRNKKSLDPIEGIWTEYAVGTLYGDHKVIKRETEPKRARWIVVKKGKIFKILNIYGNQHFFNASFTPTNKKGFYHFECSIRETKDHISTMAQVFGVDRIEMAYNAPKGVFNDVYTLSNDNLELHWEIQWLKSTPPNN